MTSKSKKKRLVLIVSFVLLISGAGAAAGTIMSGTVDSVSETTVDYALIIQGGSFSAEDVNIPALISVSDDKQEFSVEFQASGGDTIIITPPVENRGGTPLILGLKLSQTAGPESLSISVDSTGNDEFADDCELTDIVSLAPTKSLTWRINVPGKCQDRIKITVNPSQSASNDYFRIVGTLKPVAEGTSPDAAGNDADGDGIPDANDDTPFGGLMASVNDTSRNPGDPVRINISADPDVDDRYVKFKLINASGNAVATATPNLNNQGNASADLAVPQGTTGEVFEGVAVLQKTGNVSREKRTAKTDTITIYKDGPDTDGDDIPDSQDPTPYGGFGGPTATANQTVLASGDPVRIDASAAPFLNSSQFFKFKLINSTGNSLITTKMVNLDSQGNASATFVPNAPAGSELVGEAVLQQTGNVPDSERTDQTSDITIVADTSDADGDGTPDTADDTPFGGLTASVNDTSRNPGESVRINVSAGQNVTRDANISLVNTTNGEITAVGPIKAHLDGGNASEVLSIPDSAAADSKFVGEAVVDQTGSVSKANRTASTSTITVYNSSLPDADDDDIPDGRDSTPFGNLSASANVTSLTVGERVKISGLADPDVARDVNITLIKSSTVFNESETSFSQGSVSSTFRPSETGNFTGRVVINDTETGVVNLENRTAETSIINVSAGDGSGGGGGTFGDLVLFAQDGNLRSLTQDGSLTYSYGIENRVKALGPSTADFDADPDLEVPVTVNAPNQNGKELLLVDDTGEVNQTTISGVKSGGLAVGSFDGSPESVFFVDQSTNNIYRFTPETVTGKTEVKNVKAQAVVGIADIDDDGAEEIVFGGEGPNGNSETVNYVDDDRSLKGTGTEYESDDGAGLGRPADFNNDGKPRIPVVDDNQNIALVNNAGDSTVLTSGEFAKEAQIATTDWDSDGSFEIMFLATDGELKYIDNVTNGNNLRVPVDDNGNAFTNFDTAPGVSGGQRASAQTQTLSRTNAGAQTHAVYVESGSLKARQEGSTASPLPVTGAIKSTGSRLNLTGGPAKEYPVVLSDNSGTLKLNGTGTALTTDIKTQPVAVRSSVGGPGYFNMGTPSIYYTRSSDGAIVRTSPGGTNATYSSVTAQVVAGPADIDGDNAAELIFGGNGPSGNSQTINYIDDDGSLEGTKVPYGSNNAAGVGEPADFDGDGVARVPIVTGNNEIALVDGAGRKTILTSEAAKSAPATVDYDGDSELEIVYIATSGELRYVDDVTGSASNPSVGGGSIMAAPDVGVR